MRIPKTVVVSLIFLIDLVPVTAQFQPAKKESAHASVSSPNSINGTVPLLINVTGVLKDQMGGSRSGFLGLTFGLYKDQEGGTPLWLETQNVQVDQNGQYVALLGSASKDGLPLSLFATSEARWIGVQVLLPGEVEQPRIQLVSVAYAMKALDADTLGGRPLSAFVLAADVDDAGNAVPTSPTNELSSGGTKTSQTDQVTGSSIVSNPSSTQSINAPSKEGVVPLQIKGNASNNSLEIYDSQNQPALQSYFTPQGAFVSKKSPTFSNLVNGSVLFSGAGGLLNQDSANFFWDTTVSALKLGPRNSPFWGSAFDFPIYRFAARKNSSSSYTTGFGSLFESTVSGEAIAAGYFLVTDEHSSGTVPYTQSVAADAFKTEAGTTTNLWAGSFYANAGSVGKVDGMASIVAITNTNSGARVRNNYGILVMDQADIGLNSWAIKTGTGKVQFGDTVQADKNLVTAQVSVSFNSYLTFDASTANSFKTILAGDVTSSALSNGSVGQQVTLILCQDGAGKRTLTWPEDAKLSDGAFILSTAANKCDSWTAVYDGSNWYEISRAVNM
ncbi:MAG: hypothetical protein A3F68_12360 [Acidobacteria bacterium RIFCSPLOWO2_12_FULL_54_10]|nr:MAG: hypothetical protein A3F68_12360 [Acidobacteria bacterium RIFCSPLOWO2_12_FULL_54_10]OFW14620.1 MAG: hypothetical protein A3H27_07030 [Acidobacteria bacterium RIFCSPLOWO2_02_FULL_59_13]